MFPHPEGDAEGGYSYHGAPSKGKGVSVMGGKGSAVPLLQGDEDGETIYDGDAEMRRMEREQEREQAHTGETVVVPYAHRDLKPG